MVIGSGAMAAPPPQDNTAAVSAQYVADTLYSNGLLYDNGVVHNPAYVSCQENITQTDFFQCYVQVPQVAPYWIDVTASTENIRFVFNSWA